jgi:hypothetical protein
MFHVFETETHVFFFMYFQFISLWVYQKYAEWVLVGCGI